MDLKKLFSKPVYWTLAAGFATGAIAMATVLSNRVTPRAFATPEVQLKAVGSLSATEMEALRNLDSSFAALADYIAPSVVHIKSESKSSQDLMGRMMPVAGQGSGVIFRPDGYIITNDHVVGGFERVTVTLSDGREFQGKVTRAEDSDIAVVKIDAENLPTAKFGDSNKVKVGQYAIAMGSPFGFENSFTVGHVSGVGRQSRIADFRLNRSREYPDLLQTDAAINQGNSGGPLLNIEGEIIGINTAIYSENGASNGVGFAIPGNQARLIAEMLIEKGKIVRGYLGVQPVNLKPYQKKELGISDGAMLSFVDSDSPAAMAGLKQNDVVTRIGTYNIANQVDLRNAMLRYAPGQKVTIEYVRDGEKKTTELKVGTPPAQPKLMREPAVSEKAPLDLDDFGSLDPDVKKFFEEGGFNLRPFQEKSDKADVKREGKARLGIGIEDISAAKRKQYSIPQKAKGAIIVTVEKGSVAETMGLRPGDVLEQIGDTKIDSAADVTTAMKDVQWGDTRLVKTTRYHANGQATQARTVTFK